MPKNSFYKTLRGHSLVVVLHKIMRYSFRELSEHNGKSISAWSHYASKRGLNNLQIKSIWLMKGVALSQCESQFSALRIPESQKISLRGESSVYLTYCALLTAPSANLVREKTILLARIIAAICQTDSFAEALDLLAFDKEYVESVLAEYECSYAGVKLEFDSDTMIFEKKPLKKSKQTQEDRMVVTPDCSEDSSIQLTRKEKTSLCPNRVSFQSLFSFSPEKITDKKRKRDGNAEVFIEDLGDIFNLEPEFIEGTDKDLLDLYKELPNPFCI